VLGILATRVIQRSFVRRAALTGRLDNGIRDSVRTGLGYLGFIASVMAAASFLGLNASSLAIVAGGLSLGLGFGMQSIFNNFISGLILLVERPIKIGDWIAAGSSEGRVRKINVRATEIETIDKQTVIVPNAELITGSVKNWTYSDRVARVVISIGVSYDSDAEKVRELLLGIANAHPEILSVPAPNVIFMAFGESSLDFEVRTYIGDADRRIHVASDLRFQILSTLRANKIEIPFPQRDLNIRTVDGRGAMSEDGNVENHIAVQQTRTA
jgi:small-conductance mechanosensitive channel